MGMTSLDTIYVADTKNEFISRELGWKQITRAQFEQCHEIGDRLENSYVFAIGSNKNELEILRSLPPRSIFVHLYADETYSPWLNIKLLRMKSVIAVIRSYPFEQMNLFQLQKLFLNSIRINFTSYHLCKFWKYFHRLLASQILVLRQMFIHLLHHFQKVQSIRFIPGYTNLFAASLTKITGLCESGESLLDNAHLLEFVSERLRKKEITFVGQRGTYWRRYVLDTAIDLCKDKSREKDFFQIRESFGGTLGANGASLLTGAEYVNDLLNSKFSLCPPGNYSSNTFRYCESLICGSIPVIAEGTPNDPSFSVLFGPRETCKKETWPSLLQQVLCQPTLASEIDLNESKVVLVEFLRGVTKIVSGDSKPKL